MMTNTQTYTITSVANHHDAESLSVMMTSLLHHASEPEAFAFYIMDMGLSDQHKWSLRQIAAQFHSELYLIAATPGIFPTMSWVHAVRSRPLAAPDYYRLLLPYVVDTPVRRFLYIDPDTVVRSDVTLLWEDPLDDAIVAAADRVDSTAAGLTNFDASRPFHVGVLMIEAWKWRAQRLSDTLFSHMNKNKSSHVSGLQDALNAVLFHQRRSLHPRWNTTTAMFTDPLPAGPYRQQIIEAISDPAIAHFTGSVKPWNAYCPHPYKYEYEYYRARTMAAVTLPRTL
ncbi:glycosyltransferase family 8 protein [Marinococcus luteus]|uniref:glycosyltransferase family 8 protein n=1 Tax=Marinococcus luteus TaxID=1122204 RepID=UPI002ACC4C77|nr:glycosyltransferase family 8 protein [Marinococcus luteus]MDZ5781931.1 glycosyltransferase family 8 protein [Marinococcus luteus]